MLNTRSRAFGRASSVFGLLAPAVLAVTLAAPASGEVIGPFNIVAAPTSAQLIAGGGSSFDWLNVVNTATSVNDAFSGLPLGDDGYANADSGTTIQVNFAAGTLVNGPGPDFVLFDARYDAGGYSVATSDDGYAGSLNLPNNTFVATGVFKDYFYGGNGPFQAELFGAAVDLSSLGVANGAAVTSVRFTTLDFSGDPVGVGSLRVPEPGTATVTGLALLGLLVRRRRA